MVISSLDMARLAAIPMHTIITASKIKVNAIIPSNLL
jgi:hypothetical protein